MIDDKTKAASLESLMDKESRKSLAKVVTRLFDRWEIDAQTQCRLLGMASEEDGLAMLQSMRDGDALPADTAMIERVGHLLGIHKCLRILYEGESGQVPGIVYGWMTHENKRFTPTPIDHVLQGDGSALLEIRYYLEFMCI